MITSAPSFHLGICKIYNLYEGNLEPFQLWLETLDKGHISILLSWPLPHCPAINYRVAKKFSDLKELILPINTLQCQIIQHILL